MNEKDADMILRMLPDVRLDELPETEAVETRFPCDKCGGTGWVKVIHDGYTRMMRCPKCFAEREKAAILKESGVNREDYNRFTLAAFRPESPEASKMLETARRYLRERPPDKGAGFFGRSGAGKTHICIAILQAMGARHRYWTYRREIQRIKNAMYRDPQEYERLMAIAETAENLYIDDLFQGAMANGVLSNQDEQIMFDIINTRYINKRPTFFSANAFLHDITKASEPIGSRIYSMISPYIVEISGKNQRFDKGA